MLGSLILPLKYGAGPEKGRVVTMMRTLPLMLSLVPALLVPAAGADEGSGNCSFQFEELENHAARVLSCGNGTQVCLSTSEFCLSGGCLDFLPSHLAIDLDALVPTYHSSPAPTVEWYFPGPGFSEEHNMATAGYYYLFATAGKSGCGQNSE